MKIFNNMYLTLISLVLVATITLVLPSIVTIAMLSFASISIVIYYLIQNYDINYKYWLSFAGQLGVLIFVSVSFVAGLSFIANGMVVIS